MNAFCYSQNFAPLIPDRTQESVIEVAALPEEEAVSIRRCADGKMVKAEHQRFGLGSVGMIRFSSGTTGKSKGVILSTNAILARAKTFSLAYSGFGFRVPNDAHKDSLQLAGFFLTPANFSSGKNPDSPSNSTQYSLSSNSCNEPSILLMKSRWTWLATPLGIAHRLRCRIAATDAP
jgi:hypothetical protein